MNKDDSLSFCCHYLPQQGRAGKTAVTAVVGFVGEIDVKSLQLNHEEVSLNLGQNLLGRQNAPLLKFNIESLFCLWNK